MNHRSLERLLPPALVALVILGIWEGVSAAQLVPPFILPPPSTIVATLVAKFPDMLGPLGHSFGTSVLGLGISVVGGMALALVLHSWTWARRAFLPLVTISQAVPLVVLAPLFVLLFGFGSGPKIMVVVLVCFFPVVTSTLKGFSSVTPEQRLLAKSLHMNAWAFARCILLPASTPAILGGVRIAATYAVMGAVIAEWVGGSEGLGVYLLRAQKSYATASVFAATVLLVAATLFQIAVLNALERLLAPWLHRQSRHLLISK